MSSKWIIEAMLTGVLAVVCSIGSLATYGHDLAVCSATSPNDLLVADFYGQADLDNFGIGLDSAGDFDGDGSPDIIVGAPYSDVGATDAGAAYIFLGGDHADTVYDYAAFGQADDDQLGYCVAGVGDLDGDGFDDVAIGVRYSDIAGPDRGAVRIVYGSKAPFGTRQLLLTGDPDGPNAFGHAIAAGDFNGDHYIDLAISAPFDIIGSPQDSIPAKVYIFYGGPTMDTTADLVIPADGFSYEFGCSLACAGDLNHDGYDDLVVGARYYGDWRDPQKGKAYIYFGGNPMDANADVELVGENRNCWLGYAVAGAGDVNHDGYDDVLIGSPYFPGGGGTNPAYGRVYVLYGGQTVDNVPDLILDGQVDGDQFGWSLDGAMDLNGDGYDDIIVGARFNDCASQDGGAAYVFCGGDPMDTTADIAVGSVASDDALGSNVAMIGDWLKVGAPLAAASAIWNDAGEVVNDPMQQGALGAVFAFTLTDYVKLRANFEASPTSGDAPLTVLFTDQSVGDANSWQWDFGDGGSSTIQDPNHTYNSAGAYTVSLTVSGSEGSDVETKTDYIVVSGRSTPGDFDGSGCVDSTDLTRFSEHWMATGCGDPDWCGGADFDMNADVDFKDLAAFVSYWLAGCGS